MQRRQFLQSLAATLTWLRLSSTVRAARANSAAHPYLQEFNGMKWVGYQRRWLADPAMQKLAVKSRRIGFSEIAVFERACRAVGLDLSTVPPKQTRPVTQLFISAGLSQSKDLLARCMVHVRALALATPAAAIEKEGAVECRLKNGAILRAFSSNPATMRGYEGDVMLDEFGAMPRKEKVWSAAAPLAKPTLRAPNGFKIVIIGTPEGDENLFYEMADGKRRDAFSQHRVNVEQAVADGFPLKVQNAEGEMVPGTIADLMAEIGDPDIFAQEYMCSFLAANMRYISSDLYDTAVWDGEIPQESSLKYGGMDVARTNDASAIAILELLRQTLWQHVPVDTRQRATWDDQEAWIDDKIRTHNVSKLSIDATGIGSQFAERLVRRFGARIEPLQLTGPIVEELATGMKLMFERKKLRLLPEDQDLRRDVLALRRIITPANNIRFDAPRTKGGHADRAYAFMHAIYASGLALERSPVPVVHAPSRTLSERQLPASQRDGFTRPPRGGWK